MRGSGGEQGFDVHLAAHDACCWGSGVGAADEEALSVDEVLFRVFFVDLCGGS